MKVLLKTSLGKKGCLGDIIDVAMGYAKNFLIPNGYAVIANKYEINNFELNRAKIEQSFAKTKEESLKFIKKMDGKILIFTCAASDDGILYGSIKNKDILNEILNLSNKLDLTIALGTHSLYLDKSIKSLGIFKLKVNILDDLFCNFLINVCRTEADAEINYKNYLDFLEKEKIILDLASTNNEIVNIKNTDVKEKITV